MKKIPDLKQRAKYTIVNAEFRQLKGSKKVKLKSAIFAKLQKSRLGNKPRTGNAILTLTSSLDHIEMNSLVKTPHCTYKLACLCGNIIIMLWQISSTLCKCVCSRQIWPLPPGKWTRSLWCSSQWWHQMDTDGGRGRERGGERERANMTRINENTTSTDYLISFADEAKIIQRFFWPVFEKFSRPIICTINTKSTYMIVQA